MSPVNIVHQKDVQLQMAKATLSLAKNKVGLGNLTIQISPPPKRTIEAMEYAHSLESRGNKIKHMSNSDRRHVNG